MISIFDKDGIPEEETIRALFDLLPAMSRMDDGRTLGIRCGISPQRVLALPWNPRRLSRALRKTRAGEKAPPINATRYVVLSKEGKRLAHWYIASDGQHRTVAYRQTGRTRIGAEIDWESCVRPHRYLVCDDEQRGLALWEVADDGWVKFRIALTPEKAEIALALGAHHRPVL